MKNILLLAILALFLPAVAFASVEVVVPNKGVAGQILVSDGVLRDAGHTKGSWVDASTLKGGDGKDGLNGRDGKDADNGKIDDVEHRLNRTKIIAEGVLRLYDTKKFQINAFANYDVRGRKGHEIGMRLEYKVGKSYEERRIERLEQIIEQLIEVAHHPSSTKKHHIHK
jgi:hypothetical protein